jgi:hypothetical protein
MGSVLKNYNRKRLRGRMSSTRRENEMFWSGVFIGAGFVLSVVASLPVGLVFAILGALLMRESDNRTSGRY